MQISTFLSLPWPKAPLFTIFFSGFMLCEGENTVNIDVFELVVAQNTAIYSVLEPAVKKHCNLRRFQQRGRQNRCYLRGFLRFHAKTSSLDNLQKHCKNQCFCPAKTAKTVAQTAPKSQNLVPRPPDNKHEKKERLETENRRPNVKKLNVFNVYLADSGRAHAVTSPFRAVKHSIFLIPPSRPIKNSRFWPRKGPPPQVNLTLQLLMPSG